MPPSIRPWLVLAALLAAACRAPVASTPTPAVRKASPVPSSAPASAVSAAPVKLEAPTGATAELSGTVLVAPGYMVAQGFGKIVAQGGGNVVAAGKSSLITNDGGSLITNDGGSIVAQGGGNIVASGAGNIVAQGGGNAVSTSAGNIVAQGGGNAVAPGAGTISTNGGGIVAQGGGNHHLLEASQAQDMLPGAGMLVAAVSLRTHQYLPVGSYLDAAGKRQLAYSIYSNAEGKYRLFLPKEEQGNVMIVANVPGSLDDRLVYNVVTPNAATELGVVDEDTALASRFVHFAFVERMMGILAADDNGLAHISEIVTFKDSSIPEALKLAIDGLLREMNQAARPYPMARWKDPGLLRELAIRVCDRALSETPGDPIITKEASTDWTGPDEPAYATLGKCLRTLRQATSNRLATEPGYFLAHDFDFAGDCHNHYLAKIPVLKPTDPGDYIFSNFLGKNATSAIAEIDTVYIALGVPKFRGELDNAAAIGSACQAVLAEIIKVLLGNQAVHDAVLLDLKAFGDRHKDAELSDAPTYTTASPCAPVVK
ncbi:MAG: hypothetical protein JWM80_1270 [Cyanobacteria bacterium RYN_339]|nr:hypothetical protein [Cyanobacteria bacterium RYN_339]